MPHDQTNDDLYIDANGCLAERAPNPYGPDVIVHYDRIPESDITCVDGIRCTNPLRTVIDIAPEVDSVELEQMVRHCLERGMFTREEAMARLSRPDMRARPGATLLRQIVSAPGAAG